jgi:hypothetical protein
MDNGEPIIHPSVITGQQALPHRALPTSGRAGGCAYWRSQSAVASPELHHLGQHPVWFHGRRTARFQACISKGEVSRKAY